MVGVVGFHDVGKSSLINSPKHSKVSLLRVNKILSAVVSLCLTDLSSCCACWANDLKVLQTVRLESGTEITD